MLGSTGRWRRPGLALAAAVAGAWLASATVGQAAPGDGAGATVQGLNPGRSIAFQTTFATGTFVVDNTSTGGQAITRVRIDLADGPAMFPDLVFDPDDGTPAGDIGGSKGVTVDPGTTAGVGVADTYAKPNRNGHQLADIATSSLDPGDKLVFSIDTDPTSVEGSIADAEPPPATRTGPAELHGATVTVTFSDGSEFASDLSVIPGSDVDSQAVLGQGAPPAPAIARAAGASSPAVVTSAAQTVVVSGPIGATGRVLVAEGHLDVSDVPGGGVDLDAFEANTVARITQIPFTIGAGGTVNVPVTLTATSSGTASEIGINSITAYLVDGTRPGPVSAPIVLHLDGPAPEPGDGAVTFASGLAVVEAEDHDAKVARSAHDWTTGAGPAGVVASAIQATPDNGARIIASIPTTSPEVGYRVLFPAAGTYQLWVRGYGLSNGNTLHQGRDGQLATQNVSFATGSWTWVKRAIAIPSAGEHTVQLWMREDGLRVDRLLLAESASFTPTGSGPAVTPRDEAEPDITPPTLTGRQPADGATGVAVGADAVATFSEAMAPASLATSSFTLAPTAGGPAVAASIGASAGNTVFTLNPSADLAPATQYTATVTTAAEDAAGNNLAAQQTWSFTTAAAPEPGDGAVTFVSRTGRGRGRGPRRRAPRAAARTGPA